MQAWEPLEFQKYDLGNLVVTLLGRLRDIVEEDLAIADEPGLDKER